MKIIVAIGLAFGLVLVAAAPMEAAHKAVKKHWKHAHHGKRLTPQAYVAANWYVSAPKFCTYMGGPKSSLWSCR